MSGKNKISKKVLWTRIVCAFLAFLMVASVAYLSVQLIIESVKEAKAEKEAESTTKATFTEAPFCHHLLCEDNYYNYGNA